jgi:hypothetical protein
MSMPSLTIIAVAVFSAKDCSEHRQLDAPPTEQLGSIGGIVKSCPRSSIPQETRALSDPSTA